jgi:hypothetical protein
MVASFSCSRQQQAARVFNIVKSHFEKKFLIFEMFQTTFVILAL